jgi:hypothetical protein
MSVRFTRIGISLVNLRANHELVQQQTSVWPNCGFREEERDKLEAMQGHL